jgi:hypothetical protein
MPLAGGRCKQVIMRDEEHDSRRPKCKWNSKGDEGKWAKFVVGAHVEGRKRWLGGGFLCESLTVT